MIKSSASGKVFFCLIPILQCVAKAEDSLSHAFMKKLSLWSPKVAVNGL